MTPEQQRIAIAEACGWRHTPAEANPHFWFNAEYQSKQPELIYSARNAAGLPDYLNDLNAMHEAERMLPSAHWDRYTQWLGELARGTRRFVVCHATAAQRAEAFLRTLDLWK